MYPYEIVALAIGAIVLTGIVINTAVSIIVSFKHRMDPKIKDRLQKVTWN